MGEDWLGLGLRILVHKGTQIFNVLFDDLYFLVEGRRGAIAVGSFGDEFFIELKLTLSARRHDDSLSGWG